MIRILPISESADLLRNRGARLEEAESTVRPILEDVERRGDTALHEYARRFVNFTGASFAADPFIERTLGRPLRDEFVHYKTVEWESYHLGISAWEVERYSHLF